MENLNVPTPMWFPFDLIGPNLNEIFCNICQQKWLLDNTSVDFLDLHLQNVHGYFHFSNNIVPENPTPEMTVIENQVNDIQIGDQVLVISPFPIKLLLHYMYEKRIPPQKIISCPIVRKNFQDNGYILPDDYRNLELIVGKAYESKVAEITDKINEMKRQNQKFNLAIEEWPFHSNDLYLVIRVYYTIKEYFNLGIIVFTSDGQSEQLLEIVQQRLNAYGISFHRDIVFFTCGGSKVVRNMASISSVYEQKCYIRAFQKSLLNILFRQEWIDEDEIVSKEKTEHYYCTCDLETNLFVHAGNSKMVLSREVELLVHSIRNIISHLQQPKNKEMFDILAAEMNHHKVPLFMACPYNWKAITHMMKNFYAMKILIRSTLKNLNLNNLWDHNLMEFGSKIQAIFDMFLLTIDCLSDDSSNLIIADHNLKIFFTQLRKIPNKFTSQLLAELSFHLGQRRNNIIVSLAKFLANPNFENQPGFFQMSPEKEMIEAAILLYDRLFGSGAVSGKFVRPKRPSWQSYCKSATEDTASGTPIASTSKNYYSDCYIVSESPVLGSLLTERLTNCELLSLTQDDFDHYKRTGIRGEKLDALFNVLVSVNPSFTRKDVIWSTSPKIYYLKGEEFSPLLVHQINILKNL